MSTESYDVDATVVELRARVRELEAELARRKISYQADFDTFKAMMARAEKAEAARDSWRNQAKVQEARVVELEATVTRLYRTPVFERQAARSTERERE